MRRPPDENREPVESESTTSRQAAESPSHRVTANSACSSPTQLWIRCRRHPSCRHRSWPKSTSVAAAGLREFFRASSACIMSELLLCVQSCGAVIDFTFQKIFANRIKDVQHAAASLRPSGMRNIGRDNDDVAGPKLQRFAGEGQFKVTF